MKPAVTAIAAALISGVAMYTVGARTATVDAFTPPQGDAVERARMDGNARSFAPGPSAASVRAPRASARASVPAGRPDSELRSGRSWGKSALVIGGSAASGAGVGAVVNGRKGALIGAAIGGGAASIYEATRRH